MPSERLPELQTTGVPTPFVLESCVRVVDAIKAEKRVHQILVKWRQASNREFFQISLSEALGQCVPNLTEFLVATVNGIEINKPRISQDEEQIMLFIAQAQKEGQIERCKIWQRFNFSNVKRDYVFGSLLKRKFVCEVASTRKFRDEFGYHDTKIKIVKLQHAGIQYLLDSGLITQAEL